MIRVVELEIAWSLHAYLRFIKADYSCDENPTNFAMGRSCLPIVVFCEDNKCSILHEKSALEKLQESFSPLFMSKSLHRIDQLAASFIRDTIISVYNQLCAQNGNRNEILNKLYPLGMAPIFTALSSLNNVFAFDRNYPYPYEKSASLLLQLQKHYAYINGLLEESGAMSCWIAFDLKRTSTPINSSEQNLSEADCMGISDALLFGHIASVMQDVTIGPIILKYKSIMGYFKHICRVYFTSKDPLHPNRQIQTNALLEKHNRLTRTLNCISCDMLTQYLSSELLLEDIPSPSRLVKSFSCNNFGTDELTIPFIYNSSDELDGDIVMKSKNLISSTSILAVTSIGINQTMVEDIETNPSHFSPMELTPKDLPSIARTVFLMSIAISFVSYWQYSRR
mmetsp:Transcript_29764/g.42482  ORF Transcript_29764/g.42482 Transcript_29764/m.42482 type:complete len:395 (+) Transcript_29764:23-1207(+)